MGEPVGVVRTNISVPRDLKARMDAAGERVNWSNVAAQAFEAKLLELDSRKEVETMDDVIARMKAADELDSKEDYQAGRAAGEAWAKESATPKQLRRLSEHLESLRAETAEWWDDCIWQAPWGATGSFALAVMGMRPAEADRGADADFWEAALGDDGMRINDPDFFHGFADGAEWIWDQVRYKL